MTSGRQKENAKRKRDISRQGRPARLEMHAVNLAKGH